MVKLENIRSIIEPLRILKDRWGPSTYTAFDRTQTNLERLNAKLSELESQLTTLLNTEVNPSLVVKSFFLTADLTVPIPDEPNGTLILYIFQQDPTGGWIVTFPALFIGTFPDAVSTTADSVTSLAFLKTVTDMRPVLAGVAGIPTV